MRISDLITALQHRMEKHGDIEVQITWEGTTRDINACNVYKSKEGVLYMDADENCYKDDFALDAEEGEDGV